MGAKPLKWPLLLKVGAVGLLGLLWLLGPILPPFIMGIFLAYLYDPLSHRLQRMGISPTWTAILLTLWTYIMALILVVLLWPFFRGLSHLFSENFYEWAHILWKKILIWIHHYPFLHDFFKEPLDQSTLKTLHNFSMDCLSWTGRLGLSIWHNGWALAQILCTILLSPVISFYFIKDRKKIRRGILSAIPPRNRDVVLKGLFEIHQSFSSYVRGQTLVCGLLGTYYSLSLGLSGMEFGFTLGLLTGLLAFVPYIAFLTSLMTSLLLSLGNASPPLIVITMIYAMGYILDGLILTPWIVGKNTGLHPMWLLFSVFVGATLKGFTGIFLALPTATLIAACARLTYRAYLKSSFYQKKHSV